MKEDEPSHTCKRLTVIELDDKDIPFSRWLREPLATINGGYDKRLLREASECGGERKSLGILENPERVKKLLVEIARPDPAYPMHRTRWGVFQDHPIHTRLLRWARFPTRLRDGVVVECYWDERCNQYWIHSRGIVRGIISNWVHLTVFEPSGNLVEMGRIQNNFRTLREDGIFRVNKAEQLYPHELEIKTKEAIGFVETLLSQLEDRREYVSSKEPENFGVCF